MGTTPDDSKSCVSNAPAHPQLQDHQELLSRIDAYAAVVVSIETDHRKRAQLLALYADELGVSISTKIASEYIAAARARLLGTSEPRQYGEPLDTRPVPWLWEGVLMPGCINLVVGLPKVGKSSLLIGLLMAWSAGSPSFLGPNLHGHCPPCFVVGTDQPESDWAAIIGTSDLPLPFVALWSSGSPLYLTEEGIAALEGHAAANPGALFLLDSYFACTAPMGLEENSPAYAAPLLQLQAALAPHNATIVVLHHSNKGAGTSSATAASRGTTALPAIASQVVAMAWLKPTDGAQVDRRVVLKSEGRGGKPTQLLIERTDNGWISHGDAAAVMVAEARAEAEESLTDRQTDALAYIEDRAAMGFSVTARELASHLNLTAPRAHKTLTSLQRHGLIREAGEVASAQVGGRPAKLFAPTSSPEPQLPRVERGKLGEEGEKGEIAPLARMERRSFSPSSSSSPLYAHPAREGEFPPPRGAPVQIQRQGIWHSGWILSAASGAHDLTVEREGNPSLRHHGLRWGIDCRADGAVSNPNR
jgi:hypothetical protein